MHFIKVLHLIVALKLLRIDATVTITQTGVDAGNGYFECGETLILTCEISGNSGSMTWQNDSSSSPLAQCVGNICEVNPDLADKFDFSANVSIGIYNLTFVVTNDNNGSTYVCDDGNNNFNMSHISVRDLRPTLIQTNQNKLKAVSGCINENENCEFKWKKIKANNSEESVYDISCLNEEESVEAAACVLDEECGGLDLIQKVMTIDDGKGGPDDYYLKVVLSCNGVEMESVQTSDTHKVTCLNTTHVTNDLGRETTTLAKQYTPSFTNINIVDITVKPNESEDEYEPLLIAAGILFFLTLLGLIIYKFVYQRQCGQRYN